jgi:hypothetical protein
MLGREPSRRGLVFPATAFCFDHSIGQIGNPTELRNWPKLWP